MIFICCPQFFFPFETKSCFQGNQSYDKEFCVYSDFIQLTIKLNVLFGINIPYMETIKLFGA